MDPSSSPTSPTATQSGPAGTPGRPPRAPVSITVCPGGPLLVRGAVEILDASGAPVPRRRRTVALCRCGATGVAPYCDGSHKVVGWTG
jgi:Iron-binding zinc finger CDGSH type